MPQDSRTPARVTIKARHGKSPAIAFVLTLLLGPVGLFYSSVVGGIFMLTITLIVALAAGGSAFLVTWPICIVWGVIATIAHART